MLMNITLVLGKITYVRVARQKTILNDSEKGLWMSILG